LAKPITSSTATPEDETLNKGVEKTKTASRNKNVPHGRLLQVFCNLEGFDVDKSFIVDTANQTEKNINKTLVFEGAKHLKA